MKNLTIRAVLLMALFSLLLYACDTYQEDAAPTGDELLDLAVDRQIRAGGSVIFDLKNTVNTDQEVNFQISREASKGTLEFIKPGILKYQGNSTFKDGVDFFAVQILEDQEVLDTDSITIEIVSDSTDIPCFAGAISDRYIIEKGQSFSFNVLANDGYCTGVTDSIGIYFDSPQQGTLEHLGLGDFIYTPNEGFLGKDQFIYWLDLLDQQDSVHVSMALVEFEVIDENGSNSCIDEVFPYQNLELETPLQESYEFQIHFPSALCILPASQLSITEVSNGTAELFDNNSYIRYYPAVAHGERLAFIKYTLDFDGTGSVERLISVSFTGLDTCQNIQAIADSVVFNTSIDPVGEWLFDPLENDSICSELPFDLFITQQPNIGSLSITAENLLKYEAPLSEILTDEINDLATYRICMEDSCSEAPIKIKVIL